MTIERWRRPHNNDNHIDDLRTQLAEAGTALAAKPQALPAVEAMPPPSAEANPGTDAAVKPAKAARDAAAAVLVAEYARQAKTLMEDPGYRKARRFQQRAVIDRASEQVQQRQRELLQASPN